jgi:two-component system response regulator MprA
MTMEPMRILVVDDEPAVRDTLERALRLDGYDVESAEDGLDALDRLATFGADAIVLDRMMPRLDGIGLCQRLREAGDRTPILVLTARDGIDDRILGLDAGADDYLVKPFSVKEMRARVRALLRRARPADQPELLRFAGLSLDTGTYESWRGDRPLALSKTEFALLELFMRAPRRALTRKQIFEHVWGYDFGATSNALGVYVGYLRRKTEAGGEPRLVHTVRGVGYALREP